METEEPEMNPDWSCNKDEIQEIYEKLKAKNEMLEQIRQKETAEGLLYKQKYNVLKERVQNLNRSLEKSATIFSDLLENVKSSLELGRLSIANSPVKKSAEVLNVVSIRPGPSQPYLRDSSSAVTQLANVCIRKKIAIEPINLQELQESAENADTSTTVIEEDEEHKNEGLSTIIETEEDIYKREVTVMLEKLPDDVIYQQISKYSLNEDLTVSNENLGPTFSSTPNKLDVMKISPTLRPNFINTRKRSGKSVKSPKKESLSAPLEESEISTRSSISKRKKRTRSNSTASPPKENQQTPETYGRPSRKAKPQSLKEESLRTKKRRN